MWIAGPILSISTKYIQLTINSRIWLGRSLLPRPDLEMAPLTHSRWHCSIVEGSVVNDADDTTPSYGNDIN